MILDPRDECRCKLRKDRSSCSGVSCPCVRQSRKCCKKCRCSNLCKNPASLSYSGICNCGRKGRKENCDVAENAKVFCIPGHVKRLKCPCYLHGQTCKESCKCFSCGNGKDNNTDQVYDLRSTNLLNGH